MSETESLLQAWEQEAKQPFEGWNFGYLGERYQEDNPPWSYETLVRNLLPQHDSLLDMGTGGGEFLSSLKDDFPAFTCATEGYSPNVLLATQNLRKYRVPVIPYNSEDNPAMPFADECFSLVINRHESFDIPEIARILRPGGVFITQQVDGRNQEDLHELLRMESEYTYNTLHRYRSQAVEAGLTIDRAEEWAGESRFADVGALIYYLKAIPWEAPDDFSVRQYQDILLDLYARPKPLIFTSRRFLLQISKR